MPFADSASLFVVIPVGDVIVAFNAPVLAVILKHICRAGQVGRFTGDSVGDLSGLPSGYLVKRNALDHKSLSHMGEV